MYYKHKCYICGKPTMKKGMCSDCMMIPKGNRMKAPDQPMFLKKKKHY